VTTTEEANPVATWGTIVCGVDGSQSARDALQLAGALSERLGLRLVAVHVARDEQRAHEGANGGTGSSRSAERLLDDVADQAAFRWPLERRLARGDRAGALAAIAAEEGADLIVIGSSSSRRRRFRDQATLAGELEKATSCPVVVAPPQTRRRSALRLARPRQISTG
jgi:nucleotide-binding universal stress UspA family protein